MHSASRNVRTRNSHIDNSTIERAMFGISLPDTKEKRTDSAMKRKDRYSLDLEIKQYLIRKSKQDRKLAPRDRSNWRKIEQN